MRADRRLPIAAFHVLTSDSSEPCLRRRRRSPSCSSAIPRRRPSRPARLHARTQAHELAVDPSLELGEPPGLPGRPERPQLVEPGSLKRRGMQSEAGRAALLHALAHIEFNAINLALDAVWRFASMPRGFLSRLVEVAAEEAHHFSLLSARLARVRLCLRRLSRSRRPLGNGASARAATCSRAWRSCRARWRRAGSTRRRRSSKRLAQAGDHASAAILDVILRDEIGHVLIGNRWFRFLCTRAGVDPHPTYARPRRAVSRAETARPVQLRSAPRRRIRRSRTARARRPGDDRVHLENIAGGYNRTIILFWWPPCAIRRRNSSMRAACACTCAAGARPTRRCSSCCTAGWTCRRRSSSSSMRSGDGWQVLAPDARGFGLSAWPVAERGGGHYWFQDYLADLDALLDHYAPSWRGESRRAQHGRERRRPVRGRAAAAGAPRRRSGGLRARRRRSEAFARAHRAVARRPARAARTHEATRRSTKSPTASCARIRVLRAGAPAFSPDTGRSRGDDGRFRLLADPAHKLRGPLLYRLDEVMAVWSQVRAKVLHVEAAGSPTLASIAGDVPLDAFKSRFRAFPDWREEIVDDAGHMLHHDQPERVAALIAQFCA